MFTDDLVKRYATPLSAAIALEIIGVALMMLGVLPREAALFLLGIFVFFVIFAPLKSALLFSVFSIPLYTALPISDSFDSMASWRIIVAILFLRVLGYEIRILYEYMKNLDKEVNSYIRMAFVFRSIISKFIRTRLGVLISAFFALGVLSLLVAQEPVFGIRKLMYLANIFALFFVVHAVIKNREDFIDILKYTFAGSVLTLLVGYAQFIAILFVPLYSFWQWWASHVIPVFYGANLSDLLSYSNTWFSYYEEAEPTLRMFSTFPDSHSFALSMVLVLPMALTFFMTQRRRALFYGIIVLILLAIIFSGTRGVWVGVLPVCISLAAILGFSRAYRRGNVVKAAIISFLVFALLFPVSSQFLKFSQMRQGGIVSETAFERIVTSFSARELSNKGRIQIWKSTLESIIQRPFLGVGIGNYPTVLQENVSATKKGASAHSLYLDVVAEMGIAAGIILFLIFFEILRRALRVFHQSQDVFFTIFAGFFAVSFLWAMTYSVVDVVLLNDKVLLLFTTLVALAYSKNNANSNARLH